jgi:hypothetical protein
MGGGTFLRSVTLLSTAFVLISHNEGLARDLKLENMTQNRDKNLASAERFTVLPDFPLNGVVRDNNTGLVWERAPSPTGQTWVNARRICLNKDVSESRGWRLPSVAGLASLIDTRIGPPFVPVNIFLNISDSRLLESNSGHEFSDGVCVGREFWDRHCGE